MKIGVHSASFVKDWSEDITPYIIQCKEAGYNCVEVSLLGQTSPVAGRIERNITLKQDEIKLQEALLSLEIKMIF